jgi:hypothetical protein
MYVCNKHVACKHSNPIILFECLFLFDYKRPHFFLSRETCTPAEQKRLRSTAFFLAPVCSIGLLPAMSMAVQEGDMKTIAQIISGETDRP